MIPNDLANGLHNCESVASSLITVKYFEQISVKMRQCEAIAIEQAVNSQLFLTSQSIPT